jgi:hypothetical protein
MARLLRFLVRYYPPGILLEYSVKTANDPAPVVNTKMVDLLTLCAEYVAHTLNKHSLPT